MYNIITRCSRPFNLSKVKESIFLNPDVKITWWITFDTSSLKDIDADVLTNLQSPNIKLFFRKSRPGDYGESHNYILEQIESGWCLFLDDDNILHPNLFDRSNQILTENPKCRGIIFSQFVGGKDFSGLDIRVAHPDNIKVSHIDMAQFLIRRDLVGESRFTLDDYKTDGIFIENLYKNNSDDFVIIDEVLSYYNHLEVPKMPVSLPKILLVSDDVNNYKELKSIKLGNWEDDRLNIKCVSNSDVKEALVKFDPDTILSIGEEGWQSFSNLVNQPLDIRKRWIHNNGIEELSGEWAYRSAMNFILTCGEDLETPLISFFTPIYNTGDKLRRTYQSLKDQNYSNWEWVIVNDSTDGGRTLRIAEELASEDPRIEIYDFRKKSGGVIGESKWRAASLCRGKWIKELDHDDYLTEDAGELMVKAFKKYPECKFVFSDCAEIDELGNSLTYGEGFAFGYGKYRDEKWRGKEYKVAICQNINPKTIRHIVGVPNHFRAWEKDFYFSVGGHNRRLTIADDYELIVRSFLKTRFVGIRKMLYIQYFHNSTTINNTQNSCRADIQRRVRTISNFYNLKIKERFEELGLRDWAWEANPNNPLLTGSKFGLEENAANLIWNPKDDYVYHQRESSSLILNM